jgi:hypothetical protein
LRLGPTVGERKSVKPVVFKSSSVASAHAETCLCRRQHEVPYCQASKSSTSGLRSHEAGSDVFCQPRVPKRRHGWYLWHGEGTTRTLETGLGGAGWSAVSALKQRTTLEQKACPASWRIIINGSLRFILIIGYTTYPRSSGGRYCTRPAHVYLVLEHPEYSTQ